jgi:hypothetical protein
MSNDKKKGPAVSYYDGAVLERNLLLIAGKLDYFDDDDYSHGRVFSHSQVRWGARDLPWSISSVCAYRPKGNAPAARASCSVGEMSGQVEIYWSKGVKIEHEMLPGADKHGPDRIGLLHLHQIIQIEDDLYVVGIDSQVFRRHQGKWEVFNQGIEPTPTDTFLAQGMKLSDAVARSTDSSVDLESIDGTSSENLFAVGFFGAICHRGKGPWRRLEKVTNAMLHRVKCVDANTVYAVGDNGILLKGNAHGFKVIPTGINDDLWGLEWFKGKLYIGSRTQGLFVFDGTHCHKVTTTPKINFECHTLNAYDGQLLALGSKTVYLSDDGVKWEVVPENPDNV